MNAEETKANKPTRNTIKEAKSLIAKAKTDQAIDLLIDSYPLCENGLILFKSRLIKLEEKEHSGVLSSDQFHRSYNKINKGILKFIETRIENTNKFQRFVNNYKKKKKKSNKLFLLILFLFALGRDNIKTIIVAFLAIIITVFGIKEIYSNGNQILSVVTNGNWIKEVNLDITQWEISKIGSFSLSGESETQSKLKTVFGSSSSLLKNSSEGAWARINGQENLVNGIEIEFPENQLYEIFKKHIPSFDQSLNNTHNYISQKGILQLENVSTGELFKPIEKNDFSKPKFSAFNNKKTLSIRFSGVIPSGRYDLKLFISDNVYKAEFNIGELEFVEI